VLESGHKPALSAALNQKLTGKVERYETENKNQHRNGNCLESVESVLGGESFLWETFVQRVDFELISELLCVWYTQVYHSSSMHLLQSIASSLFSLHERLSERTVKHVN